MKDLMIDLETLGNEKDAVVVSIGACYFDPVFGRIGEKFSINLNTQEQLSLDRTVTSDAIEFWMSQPEAAKKVFREKKYPVDAALCDFIEWIVKNCDEDDGPYVWGNGSVFDIPIIEDILRQYELIVPWNYKRIMDLRTFRRFVGNNEEISRTGIHHNALDDAVNQAVYVIKHSRKREV